LVAFQNHADAWTRVDAILDRASFPETKLIALNILDKTVKERWKILPKEQCEGIRGFIVSCMLPLLPIVTGSFGWLMQFVAIGVIKLSSDPATLKANQSLIKKMDQVLVQVRYFPLCYHIIFGSTGLLPAQCLGWDGVRVLYRALLACSALAII
jgi:exportin-1